MIRTVHIITNEGGDGIDILDDPGALERDSLVLRVSGGNDGFVKDEETHIYQRQLVAEKYDKSFVRDFPGDSFGRWVSGAFSPLLDNLKRPVRVFEGGVGTGQFTIPVMQYLADRKDGSSISGRDNSRPMLERLWQKEAYKLLQRQLDQHAHIELGDIDTHLKYPSEYFDLVLLGGVLHCLKDAEQSIRQLDRILHRKGHLLIVLKTDPLTQAKCHGELAKYHSKYDFAAFWQHYHQVKDSLDLPHYQRQAFIYNRDFVGGFIKKSLEERYLYQAPAVLEWETWTSLRSMISCIRHGLSFTSGQGIPQEKRIILANKMREWVQEQGLDLQEQSIKVEHRMEMLIWRKSE